MERAPLTPGETASVAVTLVGSAVALIASWGLAAADWLGRQLAGPAAEPVALLAQGLEPPAPNTAGWIGAGALVTATLGALFQYWNAWLKHLRDEAQRRDEQARLEREAKEARHDLANRMQAIENQQHLMRISMRSMYEALKIDRQWIVEAHAEFGKPLPDGFGQRLFDRDPALRELIDSHRTPDPDRPGTPPNPPTEPRP